MMRRKFIAAAKTLAADILGHVENLICPFFHIFALEKTGIGRP